jgi:DNA helicase-4
MFGGETALVLFLVVFPVSVIAILLQSYRYYKRRSIKQLRDKESEIEQAYNELQTIWDRDRYLEHKTITQWLKDWSHLEQIVSRNVDNKFASSELRTKISRLFSVFNNTEKEVSERNELFIQKEMVKFKKLFDSVEKYPLTQNQIRSIITDEYSNLVIAGAGTGKTSTIVGKTAYILEKELAKPNDLLLLSFARDARQEMFSRIKSQLNKKLEVKTFHSFGLGIIAEAEGTKPSVSPLSDDNFKLWEMIENFIFDNLKDEVFSKLLNEYFLYHYNQYKSIFSFETKGEYIEYLKAKEIRSLKRDVVKSLEECDIANFLYVNGVEYEYEKDYEVATSTKKHRQYKPDFYLPEYGLYIEHFALNKDWKPPAFIDKAKYLESLEWKRQLHESNQTKLIETYSYEKSEGMLLTNLEKKLLSHDVKLSRISEDRIFEEINELGHVNRFARLLSTFLNLFKSSNMSIGELRIKALESDNKERATPFVDVFSYILTSYTNYLISTGEVDFNDMISLSEKYLKEKENLVNYRYVLVDEFQDISQSRHRLLSTVLKQNPDCKLFCVGDDWQSIFRFAGSDMTLMKDFEQHFGYTKLMFLEKTFRFNDKICEFSSKFIMQNPYQIPKKLEAIENLEKQTVKILISEDEAETVNKILEEINSKSLYTQEIFIIGRYNNQKPDYLRKLQAKYRRLQIKFITAHKSKGTEADYVILIGMKSGVYGFPCQIDDDPLLDLVLSKGDNFPHSEERRLFYVAVTRAKKEAYLIASKRSVSQFIAEALTQDYSVQVTGEALGKTRCPECETGYIQIVEGGYSPFYACSNYPYCQYRPHKCPKCENGFLIEAEPSNYNCVNDYCGFKAKVCPKCKEGYLYIQSGPYSDFVGCSNYPDCKYKEKLSV